MKFKDINGREVRAGDWVITDVDYGCGIIYHILCMDDKRYVGGRTHYYTGYYSHDGHIKFVWMNFRLIIRLPRQKNKRNAKLMLLKLEGIEISYA